MVSALWVLFVVLLVAWLVGFAIGWGTLTWVLLGGALAVLAFNIMTARRRSHPAL